MNDQLSQWEESMARPMRGEYENAWQMHDPLGQLEESMLGQWEECMRYPMQTVWVISPTPPLLPIIQITPLFLLEILSRRL